MSRLDPCTEEVIFGVTPLRKQYAQERRLYAVMIWPTYRCFGGCSYCFNSSDTTSNLFLPKEVIQKVIDEARDFQVQETLWEGGDPLLHPDIFELLEYNFEQGLGALFLTSGLISKEEARRLARLDNPRFGALGIHIDTIDPEAYRQTNLFPRTLEKKVQGYRNVLEAGFPPEKIFPCITLTRPVAESIEATIDWFVDEMGAQGIGLLPLKPMGLSRSAADLEPSLSEVRRANEYRARKLGEVWLRIGGSPTSSVLCRTFMTVKPDGDVIPCDTLMEMILGNVHREGIREIFERHRDLITFNHEIQGRCGHCENNPLCTGCRGMAYHYLGDLWASDPKCWLNPEAKEVYLRQA